MLFHRCYFGFWYENLAELRTNVSRLSELKKSMHTSQLQDNTRIINSQQQALITLENVTITKQDGVLLENISFFLTKGEGLFIHGRIGIGKTSLLRVINGHSDNFIGKITLNKIPKILFYPSDHISLKMTLKEQCFIHFLLIYPQMMSLSRYLVSWV